MTPARLELAVGDSLQLSARALDASGKPIPDATIFFRPEGLAAAQVDSTGMVRAGGVGDVLVLVTALVPGSKPILQQVVLKALPGPAKRIEIGSHPARLVPGQRVPLTAVVRSAEGDVRPDDRPLDQLRARHRAGGARRRCSRRAGRGKPPSPRPPAGSGPRPWSRSRPRRRHRSPSSRPKPRAKQGDVVRFRVVAKDAGGKPIEGVTPAWSFGPGQGEIDADGRFVAYQPGSYSVTATLGGRSASAPVTVTAARVHRSARIVGSVIRKTFATTRGLGPSRTARSPTSAPRSAATGSTPST